MSVTDVIGVYVADVKCYAYGCYIELDLGLGMCNKTVYVAIYHGSKMIMKGFYTTNNDGKLVVGIPQGLKLSRVSVIVKLAHSVVHE